jgi:hypothetical protein
MLEHKDFISQMLRCAPIRPPKNDVTFEPDLGAYEVYNNSRLTYLGDLTSPDQETPGADRKIFLEQAFSSFSGSNFGL